MYPKPYSDSYAARCLNAAQVFDKAYAHMQTSAGTDHVGSADGANRLGGSSAGTSGDEAVGRFMLMTELKRTGQASTNVPLGLHSTKTLVFSLLDDTQRCYQPLVLTVGTYSLSTNEAFTLSSPGTPLSLQLSLPSHTPVLRYTRSPARAGSLSNARDLHAQGKESSEA